MRCASFRSVELVFFLEWEYTVKAVFWNLTVEVSKPESVINPDLKFIRRFSGNLYYSDFVAWFSKPCLLNDSCTYKKLWMVKKPPTRPWFLSYPTTNWRDKRMLSNLGHELSRRHSFRILWFLLNNVSFGFTGWAQLASLPVVEVTKQWCHLGHRRLIPIILFAIAVFTWSSRDTSSVPRL